MRPPHPVRVYASALAAPPLPALFGLALVAWVGLVVVGHGAGHEAAGHGAGGHGPGASAVAAWLGMLVAMMAPLLADPLRHLWQRSLPRRRVRAVVAFVAAYVAVWTAYGAVAIATADALRPLVGPGGAAVPALALAAALGWQATPWKQVCLNRCHQAPRLAAFGLAADRDALRYGATKGVWCVGSCWALMALPLAVGRGALVVMALVGLQMLTERWRPARAPRWGSAFRLGMR